MVKKTIILGVILFSLLIASAYSASAVTDQLILKDGENDVVKSDLLSQSESVVKTKPSADITKLKYEQDGKNLKITLTVKSKIENRGTMEKVLEFIRGEVPEGAETEASYNYDFAIYEIEFSTSLMFYAITYVNNECVIENEEGEITPNSCVSTGPNIVISLDLSSEDETVTTIQAYTFDMKIIALVGDIYTDVIPDMEELEISINAPAAEKKKIPVRFEAEVEGGSTYYNFRWDFGDENSSTEQNPTHTYEKPGEYEVTLYVEDIHQEVNTGNKKITINIVEKSSDIGQYITATVDESTNDSPLLLFVALISIIVVISVIVIVKFIKK